VRPEGERGHEREGESAHLAHVEQQAEEEARSKGVDDVVEEEDDQQRRGQNNYSITRTRTSTSRQMNHDEMAQVFPFEPSD